MNYNLAEQQPDPADNTGARLRSYITWNGADLMVGLFIVVFMVVVISIAVAGTAVAAFGESSPEAYIGAALAAILWDIGFAMTAYRFAARKGGGWPSLGLRDAYYATRGFFALAVRTSPLPKLASGILTGYFMAYAATMLYGVIVDITGASFLEPAEQLPTSLFDNTFAVIVTGIAVVIAAPIAEEILFRGFLFGGLRRYLPILPAMLISGFIFSLAHFNVGLVIPFTLIGAILAYVYERSGTLYVAIGVHLLFNLTSFSLLVFFPELR